MTVNTQQVASLVRQAVAIAAIVVGALTSITLPTAVHGVLVAFGGALLVVEHYVSDTSTGTTVAKTPPAPPASPPVTTV